MTTAPVMTITDELLAELEFLAAATDGWYSEHWSDMTLHADEDVAFVLKANPTTILALIAHIRRLESRLAYIERNFVGATFNYDGAGMCAMVVRIGDRVPVKRDAIAVLDAAIAQEGEDHE